MKQRSRLSASSSTYTTPVQTQAFHPGYQHRTSARTPQAILGSTSSAPLHEAHFCLCAADGGSRFSREHKSIYLRCIDSADITCFMQLFSWKYKWGKKIIFAVGLKHDKKTDVFLG